MRVRFLLGPAGCGKTFRCLAEIREQLRSSPEGPPLLLLAPKQATFQLERQLLSDPELPGYTRLQILSFDRLAHFILEEFAAMPFQLLDEEGRVMVLRALLAQNHNQLRVFRASARLPGFAQHLSQLLRELQQHHLSPAKLDELAERIGSSTRLDAKLRDLALLLRAYGDWLTQRGLQDGDSLLDLAAAALARTADVIDDPGASDQLVTRDIHPRRFFPEDRSADASRGFGKAFRLGGLWMDGFAQLTPQERALLAAVVQRTETATLAFCLEREPVSDVPTHSPWSTVGATFLRCREELAVLPGVQIHVETLARKINGGRFDQTPELRHLEAHWSRPMPFARSAQTESRPETINSIQLVECANPEAEAIQAAREILRHVRSRSGRFRDTAVLLRSLDGYHDAIRRVFARYEIPFFLDRRESVAHHPMAELTRYGLRTVAFDWKQEDWFGALKTGLVTAEDSEIDWLENEALARGWEGSTWREPIRIGGDDERAHAVERLRQKLIPPFLELANRLSVPLSVTQAFQPAGSGDFPVARADFGLKSPQNLQTAKSALRTPLPNSPTLPGITGGQLAEALREFWQSLKVERTLEQWSTPQRGAHFLAAHNQSVWQQMQQWLDNLATAFGEEAMPLRDWLPIVEAGLGNLTVGVIPPALDQVLVGTIDRSRNPDLQLTLILGLNENVFPAPAVRPALLSASDRETLSSHGATLGLDQFQQIGMEWYYGYIACTRARRRLVLTYAQRGADDKSLNPSPFLHHLKELFPRLAAEPGGGPKDWPEADHQADIIVPLLRAKTDGTGEEKRPPRWLEGAMPFAPIIAKWEQLAAAGADQPLTPDRAARLYGPDLLTSVSALEDFAACPFKFFVGRGLRAQERLEFEVDSRERGSFQHKALEEFHRRLQVQGKRWRDVSGREARQSIRQIGEELLPTFREGLFQGGDARRFTARMLIEGLETLVETLVGWARQYQFDPAAVEVSFGLKESPLPSWRIALEGGHALLLRGRIDRIDLCRDETTGDVLGVVIDYKSSGRELDPVLLHHGIELQLLAYAGALKELSESGRADRPDTLRGLDLSRFQPAGVFYVSLKRGAGSAPTREQQLERREQARRAGYQHRGRFDGGVLEKFDNRGEAKGDQFKFSKNKDGAFGKRGNDAVPAEDFQRLIERVKEFLRQHGNRIYGGHVGVEPYRWKRETACDFCLFRSVCRFDPWVQPYRVLRPPAANESSGRGPSS